MSTSAARYQQLSLNPQKLAGQCGKLKCCLNYELDMYLDAIKSFPKADTKLQTERGTAFHVKTDVFKRQMWYLYEGQTGSGLVALSPDRVREVLKMNAEGKKPQDLNDFLEVEVKEPDYTNVVGQDSLNRFEHAFKTKKKRKKSGKKVGRENRDQQASPVAEQSNRKPANKPQAKPQVKTEKVEGENKDQAKKPSGNRNKRRKKRPGNRGDNANQNPKNEA